MIPYTELREQLINLNAPINLTTTSELAAVLVPIFVKDETILFTKRANHLKRHRGEIAFPGGKFDPSDETLAKTCLRESKEEVGLEAENIDLIGRLEPVLTTSGILVYPFVGLINSEVTLKLNPSEVADIFWAPIAKLMDPHNYQKGLIRNEMHHYYAINGFKIWGATERIVSDLINRLRSI